MMQSVELRPAYEWTCEECGRDQFAKVVIPEMSDEDATELANDLGFDPEDGGRFMYIPEQVTCCFCKSQFTTTVMMEE